MQEAKTNFGKIDKFSPLSLTSELKIYYDQSDLKVQVDVKESTNEILLQRNFLS